MKLQRLTWVAAGLLIVAAGCSSTKKAEGGGRRSGRGGGRRAARRRPPTAAERMARIDRLMADCPDFDRRVGKFRDGLDRLARVASRVAALRPALDEVDRIRSTKVTVMGQRVNVWVTLCRVSATADALNPVIGKAHQVVRRCEQIVRLKTVVAGDYRIFKGALAKARARPGEATLADVRETARGFHVRIGLVRRTWSELDGKLASIEKPLRAGRDALNSVTMSAVRDKAREMASRIGRILAVIVSVRSQLREHQSGISKVTETLKAISAGGGRR